ncbi:MAG TPA: BON domain-containing protein [Thermoanaerobaculia bacterium]|jgi:osmotically-inducible protein OsmY|nr:BON domain-containing protein [Thermoanaerobaculia bacterium]
MNRNRPLIFLSILLVALVTSACSMNRQTPASFDKPAMEGDIRAAIAAAVPGKTFALEVNVMDEGRVKLSGHVENSQDRDAILAKVRQVNGVRSVDASDLHVG